MLSLIHYRDFYVLVPSCMWNHYLFIMLLSIASYSLQPFGHILLRCSTIFWHSDYVQTRFHSLATFLLGLPLEINQDIKWISSHVSNLFASRLFGLEPSEYLVYRTVCDVYHCCPSTSYLSWYKHFEKVNKLLSTQRR